LEAAGVAALFEPATLYAPGAPPASASCTGTAAWPVADAFLVFALTARAFRLRSLAAPKRRPGAPQAVPCPAAAGGQQPGRVKEATDDLADLWPPSSSPCCSQAQRRQAGRRPEAGDKLAHVVGLRAAAAGAHETWVDVTRLQAGLCGASRPHFFRGVATVRSPGARRAYDL